jgi:hypothetical protein
MAEIYEVWRPSPTCSRTVSVEALIDDWEGFRLLLRDHDTKRVVRMRFNGHVFYMNRDEGDLAGVSDVGDGLGRGSFYVVANSELVSRFATLSLRQPKGLTHYAIVTGTDCVDVLATEPPLVDEL